MYPYPYRRLQMVEAPRPEDRHEVRPRQENLDQNAVGGGLF